LNVSAPSGVTSPRLGDRGGSRTVEDEVKERSKREEDETELVGTRRRISMLAVPEEGIQWNM
jgi:hypothetical protein